MNALLNLNNPGAIAQNALSAFEQGRAVRNQERGQNALLAVSKDPNNPQAMADLERYAPQKAAEMYQQRNQATAQQDMITKAMQGDPQANAQLMTQFPDLWSKMDDVTKNKVKRANDFMGQALFQIQRTPPEQQAVMWDNYVRQAEASGIDIPTHYERYSPEAMQALAAEAGLTSKLIEAVEPKTIALPAGGTIYEVAPGGAPQAIGGQIPQTQQAPQAPTGNVGNHMALDGFARLAQSMGPERAINYQRQHGVPVLINSPDEYARLPSGALFLPPEGGQVRVKP